MIVSGCICKAPALAVLAGPKDEEFMRRFDATSIRRGRWDPRQRRNPFSTTLAALLIILTVVLTLTGCDVERRKSDAELGLTPQQIAGRKIYDQHCDRCHEPYSTRGKKGPGLKGVFQHQYLPLSGLPANDERVADIVNHGRNEMPGFSQTLSPQDVQDLLVYMHTL
jgi:mono/diheme cytochrome c family protein